MRILRSVDYKRMPWKNGKGETVELAVFPPGASVDSFDWRISTATVAEDGPFSTFDGIDRTLSVLTGEGMELSVNEQAPVLLHPLSEPFAFAGDARTSARLTGGMITDLNVMTRRERFTHCVRSVAAHGEVTVTTEADQTVIVVTDEAQQGNLALGPRDAILLDRGDAPLALHFGQETAFFIIEIMPVKSA